MATGRGIEAAALGMRQRAGAAPIGMNRTPNDKVFMATGRGSATEREASEAGRGAAPRALLNGLVADAKQEHPRGEGIGMLNMVGILMLNTSWAY